ncbi:unnamed protein product [Triticum turgidum subsp. durum]|uniref:3-ketoacyl-CoA synthase n=1 Tax=Triticum turgidum subsp. durum TaxID=4567 RepID=A0A9R0YYF8_TRITD|nr:unnamed protein product [Triticum turgidum subsp. durum]
MEYRQQLLRTVKQATRNHAVVLMYHRLVSHIPHLLAVTLLVVVAPQLWTLTPDKARALWNTAVHAPAVAMACWAAALAAYTYASSRPQPVYLVDLAGYKPPAELEASRAKTIVHFWRCGRFSEQSMAFQKRMLERSGLGEATHFPMSLIRLPVDMCDRTAMEESHAVIFGVVDEVLRKTGVAAGDVRVLIFNSSLLSPTPSFTSLIVNRYKFRDDIVTHNLSGMGCSAGIIAIDLAKRLLQVHRNTYALVVSTENITLNAYMGNNRPMLVTNTLFRVGGAAILLTNRAGDRARSKYQLIHTVRTHRGAHDQSYGCVTQEKVFRAQVKAYLPDFKLALEHFCIHAGGRGVLDELENSLKLSPWHMEPSRMTLYRFGNTSSSSLWYELAYCEAKRRIKKGDRVWQIAFGSGFKCNSAVWRALRTIDDAGESPWTQDVDVLPVDVPKVVPIDETSYQVPI